MRGGVAIALGCVGPDLEASGLQGVLPPGPELREVKLLGCMEHTWVTAALGLSLAGLKAGEKLEPVIWSQSFYIILPYLTFT